MKRWLLLLLLEPACIPDLVPPTLADNPGDDFDGDGFTELMGDCDDLRDAVFPTANERCDGLDNDCDGLVDGDRAIDRATWYGDGDGDGFGTIDDAVRACEAPDGYVLDHTDCDDSAPERHPDTSWYQDADGDGYGTATRVVVQCHPPNGFVSNTDDCDDGDAYRAPGAIWYADADSDGSGDAASPATSCLPPPTYVASSDDCDDTDASRAPTATEVCRDGVDQDCDGVDATCLQDVSVLTGADTIVMGEHLYDDFGRALAASATALWIAAPAHDGGRVYRLELPLPEGTVGASSTATLTLDAVDPAERAGAALATDGVTVAIGRPGGADLPGRVSVWFDDQATGTRSLDDAGFAWTGELGDASGSAVALMPIGETAAVVIGAPGADRCYIVDTSVAVATPADALVTLSGPLGSAFGGAMSWGDLEGDQRADLAIAAPDAGAVYVYFDVAATTADEPDLIVYAPSPRRIARVAIGDVNGDGQADLLIGSPSDTSESWVWSFSGPLSSGELLTASATRAWFGGPASGIGNALLVGHDIDGDGGSDALAGAPSATTRGGVWLLGTTLDLAMVPPALRGAGYTDQLGASLGVSASGSIFIGAPGLDRLYALPLFP